jgi:hypothetical protein
LILATGLDRDCLRAAKISDVLVATSNLEFYLRRGADRGQLGWDAFATFAGRCLQVTDADSEYVLYHVRL